MSTTKYIPSITNRTFHNVEQAKKNPNSTDSEATNGAWNFTDMNRVINNLKYAAECMQKHLYFIEAYELVSKTDWNEKDIITQEQLRNMVSDHMANLRSYITDSALVPNWTHITSILNMDYNFANSLEKNIDLLAEALPSINKMKLTVINGSGSGEYRVGEVVTVVPDDPYYHFNRDYITDSRIHKFYDDNNSFDYIVPYSNTGEITIEFTPKDKARTLTVETHDGSETYELEIGQTITVNAHMTNTDQNFVCWHINDSANDYLRNLFEAYNAETTQFTMGSEDMKISAEYLRPNYHVYLDAKVKGFSYEFPEAVNSRTAISPVGSKIFAGWRRLAGAEDLEIDYTRNPFRIDSDDLKLENTDVILEAVYVTGTSQFECDVENEWYNYYASGIIHSDGQSRSVVVEM